MREIAGQLYFGAGKALGWLLRSSRYSETVVNDREEPIAVHKRRRWYAPLLVAMGIPLVKLLNTGVKVLPWREWVNLEQTRYRDLYGSAILTERDGTLVLPYLNGRTLADLLEDQGVDHTLKEKGIALATIALVDLHSRRITHADAMAENVLIDVETNTARWFDFETVHDTSRSVMWRRADDVRALIATCVIRTGPEDLDATVRIIVEAYADRDVIELVRESFSSPSRRSLPFHLGQASLSRQQFRQIERALRANGQGTLLDKVLDDTNQER